MLSAKEARESLEKSDLFKFFNEIGEKNVQQAIAKNSNATAFSIIDAPSQATRRTVAELAESYYKKLGYLVDYSNDFKTIYLAW